jgi:hypothetical protein
VSAILIASSHLVTFSGDALYGKEGYISRERDGEQVADYRPDGVAISAGNYYYISQGESFQANRSDLSSLMIVYRQRLSFA